jgi:hypothetical protein
MIDTDLLSVRECFEYFSLNYKYGNIEVDSEIIKKIKINYNKIDKDLYLCIDSECDKLEEIFLLFKSEYKFPTDLDNIVDRIIHDSGYLIHPKELRNVENICSYKEYILAMKILDIKFGTICEKYYQHIRQEESDQRIREQQNHDYFTDTRNALGMDYDDWVDIH